MQTDVAGTPERSRAFRLATAACEALAVFAWLLLVLRYQYGVERLQAYDASLDALFLAAIAGIALTRFAQRRGAAAARGILFRWTFAALVTILALAGAECAVRVQYRHARTSRNAGDYIARRAATVPLHVNSLGFREREIPPKTAGRYRIAIVGWDGEAEGNGKGI